MKNSEEINTVKQFLVTLLIVVLCVVGIYFFTKLVVLKESTETTEETEVIDPSKAIVGTMLNRSESEYYVLVIDTTSSEYTTYSTYESTYAATDNALKVYTVDLSNKLNEKYIASDEEEAVTVADSIDSLKFKGTTLIKVVDGKISKSFTTEKAIKKEWNITD